MKPKAGFSPWHTKQNSFDEDPTCLPLDSHSKVHLSTNNKPEKKSQSKLSSRKKLNHQETEPQSILRSFSKTQNFVTPFYEDNTGMGFRRKVTRSSQKIECEGREEKSGKKFDDDKWRILTITSNDRFKSQCAQLRKYQNLATQLKSRRSSLRQTPVTQPQQKPILQQVSIKNFIIHGHYTDKDSFYHLSKRRDASYVMKQKFATLKKTIDCKENAEPARKVVVKGNGSNREHQSHKEENLFKVIKIEREMNNNNRVL